MLKTADTMLKTADTPPPRQRQRYAAGTKFALAMIAVSVALLCGCGDPPLSATGDANAHTEGDSSSLDASFTGGDVGPSGDLDGARSNPSDALLDVDPPPDGDAPASVDSVVGGGDAVFAGDAGVALDSANVPDTFVWQKPDIDGSSLEVITTDPPMGALAVQPKFTFTLTFSAAVIDAGIQPYTVFVTDPLGVEIAGDFSVKGAVVTFKAAKATHVSSRVDVVVSTIVQGTQGQTMQAPFAYHFHTAGYGQLAPWHALATRYAPIVRLGVAAKSADWPAKERLAFDPTFAFSTVGHTVSATRSHYFITYLYRRPERPKSGGTAGSAGFSPDLSGATVVVARFPTETPVALTTWFMNGNDEQWWAWLTAEGGLLPPGYSAKKANVRAVLPLATLFPKSADTAGVVPGKSQSPRRHTAFHTAQTHQSCLWSDPGETQSKQCETHKGAKLAMNLVELVPFAADDKAPWVPVGADAKLPRVQYSLSPFDELLWPRRNDGQLFVAPLTFTYKPLSGRPAGMKHPLGSKYASLDAGGKQTSGFGRPPWAWRWKPSTNVTYYDMPRGAVFMDPAYALYQRLGGASAKIPLWDSAKKTGFSLDYCFAPQLFIDARKSAVCGAMTPPG